MPSSTPPSSFPQLNFTYLSQLLQTYVTLLIHLYKFYCNQLIEPLSRTHPIFTSYLQWFFSMAAFPSAIFLVYCGLTLCFFTFIALISVLCVQFFAIALGFTVLLAFLSAFATMLAFIHLYQRCSSLFTRHLEPPFFTSISSSSLFGSFQEFETFSDS